MMNSHVVARPKAPDEFRVLLIGDSGAWGWFLENKDTLAGRMNAERYVTANGRRVVAYNLGYPIMSLTKDLMLLDAAMSYQPDMIVWLVTLESFPRDKQLAHPILQNNPARVRRLIETYPLELDPNDLRFVVPDFWGQTIVGRRRALADMLRLQLYGVSWAATGIDQFIPREIPLRQSDFDEDIRWQNSTGPLAEDALAFDVLAAGVKRAGNVPVLIVNEPMYVSSGKNSHLRYNSFYPRWAYDAYRERLGAMAKANDWRYLDTWDSIAPAEFTNTPVHLTPKGSGQLAERIGAAILSANLR
jgi:lysophospholipase L1-like esterase